MSSHQSLLKIVLILSLGLLFTLVPKLSKGEGTKLSFTLFAADSKEMGNVFYTGSEGKPIKLEFSSSADQEYLYQGENTILFYDYMGTPGTKDFQMIPKAQGQIPANIKKATIFFLKNAEGSKYPYRIYFYNTDESAFPYQSLVAFNLTGWNLIIEQDNRAVRLGGGPSAPIRIRNGKMRIKIYYDMGSRRVVIYNASVSVAGNYRKVLVIMPPLNPKTTLVQTKVIPYKMPDAELEKRNRAAQ